ncbi:MULTISPECIES: hypothetical protein [unclassified Sedimentibacter]|uniref:hypothetical protein n=1 Tax=unclassified Sedimentibacter TaxID=2649220 RepID=UPI0027E0BA8A|nr:hypothetical protein [Sedimentibacter sp. MB35-C1]WMJ78923.1 hypothetical protein RBQ61_08325 [Sedimentibacter sp. MB35-C1]
MLRRVHFFGIYIQANVVEDIKPGDYETIIEKGSFVLDSRIMFYAISTIIIVGSVTAVQMFPCIQNKAKNFTVGEKHNPR